MYTFGKVADRVRERIRVHNTSFDSCREGNICYGVPLLPEQDARLERAGEKLADLLGFPDWLSGVAPIFDGNNAYVEVGVVPGKTVPIPLPAAVDDIPVIVVYSEHVLHGGRGGTS